MLLGNLLKNSNKNYKKISANGISFDSRKVRKKNIFFAIGGQETSGYKFLKEAMLRGASAVVSDVKKINYNYKIPQLYVKNVRLSLAEASSNFYKKKPKNIIAVTGTNGKSSVADFFYQILKLNKVPVASIGTLGIFSKKYKRKTGLTSLDSISLHKTLEILANNKINNVILEASSHGLDQKRLDYLNIKTGIFTNLSHDHLDYHNNMKNYFNSKMYLFKNLLKNYSNIITDEDNKEYKIIKKTIKSKKLKKLTIGNNTGSIKILSNKYKQNKQIIKISINSKIFFLKVPLIGFFQIKNLLMAILAAKSCGLSFNKIFQKLNKIKAVPGRLEPIVNLKNNSNVIVDFAHTPDALEQSLVALKKQFNKEIIVVFGCGGERDIKKRYRMGKIAKKYCRKIYVTDDNPRRENPAHIRKSIIKGCGKLASNIGNRKEAIEAALMELNQNEILLVAGKGHETTQDYGKKVLNFSDKKIIREIIKKKKLNFRRFEYKKFILENTFKDKNTGNAIYSNVSINTKNLKKNSLFFALKGKKKDGHNFVKEAISKGAAICIVNKKIDKVPKNKIITVKNTFSSLNHLAKVTRNYSEAEIIGITGSAGKTTLKNLVSFTLQKFGNVYRSPHSYNNKFGVPLSLSNLKKNTKYGVFEIGMDKKGEINSLAKIVKPQIGIITNISGAHFKNFKTLKDIARAKSEIIDNIDEGGNIILNKDDKFFNFFASKARKRKINIISFSLKKKADIFLLNSKKIKKYYKLKIIASKKVYFFKTKYFTNIFLNNILACVSVLHVLNLNLEKVNKEFINFYIPKGRGDINIVKKFNKKFKYIDESYNANPLSMKSAIENVSNFSRKKSFKKIIFLGDMLELGNKSKRLHKELSVTINKSDIDEVFVFGKYIKDTFRFIRKNKKGKVFNNLTEAHNYFKKAINNNDLLMVKGSNATGMSQFSKKIKRGMTSVI